MTITHKELLQDHTKRPCTDLCAQSQTSSIKKNTEYMEDRITLVSFKMHLGSQFAIQPSLQPGTAHRFDIAPRVSTGTMSPKRPIGTNGVLP
jgi:hypothetical protein